MKATKHTATEKAAILSKQTLRIKDICILFDCGYHRASEMVSEFREHNDIYGNMIPTREFLTFVNYDEDRVLKYAERGY